MDEAVGYYVGLSSEIGFLTPDKAKLGASSLDDLLAYLGYAALKAAQLQNLPPDVLMNPSALATHLTGSPPAADDVLAMRFFAPKITDLSTIPPAKVGWRKLVRLRSRAGSAARQRGITAAFILFNFFAKIDATDPFVVDGHPNDSVNTQAMLIESDPSMSPVYWLDYGPTSTGAKLSYELDAFFDAAPRPSGLAAAEGKRSYFVPCACVACHGGLQLDLVPTPPAPRWSPDKALLNYLDTDHWFDRVASGEDLSGVVAPPIFDANGFGTSRKINSEISDQNHTVQPGSIQERAVQHWLGLHADDATHVPLERRILSSSVHGAHTWDKADPSDMAVLRLLNRYCFRCHGSVEFDVFDRSMLVALRSLFNARLQPGTSAGDPRIPMPPDRTIPEADRQAIRQYVLTAH